MSYRNEIETRLHRRYEGLKVDPGIEWLDSLLCRLQSLGFSTAVRTFLSNMHDFARMPGPLLEIELLECLLNAGFPASELRDEHLVPPCTRPIDVAVIEQSNRADFQCKFINNYHNELSVARFEEWMLATFASEDPGAIFHLQATLEAAPQTFEELRTWLLANHLVMSYGPTRTFRDSAKHAIRISKHKSKSPGYFVGTVYNAIKDGEYAYKEDIPRARDLVAIRCADALGTFAYYPSASQQNFVVLSIDSLAMLSERQIYYSLYGTGQSALTSTGVVGDSGLFDGGSIDKISAVLLLNNNPLGTYDVAVFPHPNEKTNVSRWLDKPGFRLGRSTRQP